MNPQIPDYSAVYNGPNLEYCPPCQQAVMGIGSMPAGNPMSLQNNPGYAGQPASQPKTNPEKTAKAKMTRQGNLSAGAPSGSTMQPSQAGMRMPAFPSGMASLSEMPPSGQIPVEREDRSIAQGNVPPGPFVQGSIAQGLVAQGLLPQSALAQGVPPQPAHQAAAAMGSPMAPITDTTQPMPLTVESLEFLNGFLRSQIGRRVRSSFWLEPTLLWTKAACSSVWEQTIFCCGKPTRTISLPVIFTILNL